MSFVFIKTLASYKRKVVEEQFIDDDFLQNIIPFQVFSALFLILELHDVTNQRWRFEYVFKLEFFY